MKTYISLLRGVNVSGKNLIKMDSLKSMYARLDFESITTYLQSGNVVFQSKDSNPNAIEKLITKEIFSAFGYDVPVLVLTPEKLTSIIEGNPFLGNRSMDSSFFHVTILNGEIRSEQLIPLKEKLTDGEAIACRDSILYLYCPNGYGKTKLTNSFIEQKLNVKATTRNWKTTITLGNLLDSSIKIKC
jgi:uncharacterized protein (DUF1697 family)